MRYSEMAKGRTFVLVLESGENIKSEVESFCRDKTVHSAKVTVLGGMLSGSSFVSGPRLTNGNVGFPIEPTIYTTDAPMEFAGVGTVFPNESGEPVLHLHGSVGRNGMSVTGCFRDRASAWLTLEIIIEELVGSGPIRRYDPDTGVSPLSINYRISGGCTCPPIC